MIKKRFPIPFEMIWNELNGYLHVCKYLTCDDGCECESNEIDSTKLFAWVNENLPKDKSK